MHGKYMPIEELDYEGCLKLLGAIIGNHVYHDNFGPIPALTDASRREWLNACGFEGDRLLKILRNG